MPNIFDTTCNKVLGKKTDFWEHSEKVGLETRVLPQTFEHHMTPFGRSPLRLVKHLVDFDKTEGGETHQLFEVPSKTAQGRNRAFQPVSEFVVLWGARAVFLH